jgi:hypothetical protein
VITSEFDRWISTSDAPRDRLDVLGLDTDGHLVLAELKRGHAPDTTDMQALKYAAMASRFKIETLASAHVDFRSHRGETITEEEALARFENHTGLTVTTETLSRPRVVLVATSYSSSVTATAVWLNEMGVDITLMQFQAYRMPSDEIAVTVSKLYPVPSAEEFAISPLGGGRERSTADDFDQVQWTADDVGRLREMEPNPTIQAVLDLASLHPGEPVTFSEVVAHSQQTGSQARAQLAGLTMIVKRRFGRSNWPFTARWGGVEMLYTVDPPVAEAWLSGAPILPETDSEARTPLA